MKYLFNSKTVKTDNRFYMKVCSDGATVQEVDFGADVDVLLKESWGPTFNAVFGVTSDGNFCVALRGVGRKLYDYPKKGCPWEDGYDTKIINVYAMETVPEDRATLTAFYMAFIKDPYVVGNRLLEVMQVPVGLESGYELDVELLKRIVMQYAMTEKDVPVPVKLKRKTLISYYSYAAFNPVELGNFRKYLYENGISHLESVFLSCDVSEADTAKLRKALKSGLVGFGYFFEYAADRVKYVLKKD